MNPQRTALISDIHGHYVGLLAVLADARAAGCGRVLCLGDLVDGGPGDEEVVRYVRDHGILSVRGNHDETHGGTLAADVEEYLRGLPEEIREGAALYTHISPRRKKAKILDVYEAWNVFSETGARLVFVGHAHIPLLFGDWSGHACQATEYPLASNAPLVLDPQDRYIVCVGAVGYSRDGIAKPRYAIYDAEAGTVESRAVDVPTLRLGLRVRGRRGRG